MDEEKRAEVEDGLKRYQQRVQISKKLSGPLKAFAEKIDGSEELEAGWKAHLASELLMVRLGGEYEYADAEPGEMIRDKLNEVIQEGDDYKTEKC